MHANRLWIFAGLLGVAAVAYMLLGARGSWDFLLPFRGTKLLALITVATAIALATLLFQTISGNRILTPSIMGFDALFVLIQTGLVFMLGGLGYVALSVELRFAMNGALMLLAALLLFGTLLGQSRADLHRMILTGIIFGVLFRSLTAFMQRMIDPSEYSVIQVASFARFNRVETELVYIAAAIVAVLTGLVYRHHTRLDVIELGRDAAVNLGLNFDRAVIWLLLAIATLVAVSTALVGPVVFFGLLVTALVHKIVPTHRHAILIPAAILLSAAVLVGGQTLFERVLRLETALSVVIEFLGGLVFLFLILRKAPT